MKIKLLKFLYILAFISIIISCKSENNKISPKKSYTQKSISSNSNKDISKYSFTISCGSGCALIYNSSVLEGNKIGYKIDQFINESLVSQENDKLSFFTFDCSSSTSTIKVYDTDKINILKSVDHPNSLKEELKKAGSLFCDEYGNKQIKNPISNTESASLPFEASNFISKTSENRENQLTKLNDIKSLGKILYGNFYETGHEVISEIYKLKTNRKNFNSFIVISENEVGNDCSIISVKKNKLISALVLNNKESDYISNKATINKKLDISLDKVSGENIAKYKISDSGIIDQVFDSREHMKNYNGDFSPE